MTDMPLPFRALLENLSGLHTLSALERHPPWANLIDELWWSEDEFARQEGAGRLGECVAFVLDGQSYLLAEIPMDQADGEMAYLKPQDNAFPVSRLPDPLQVEVRVGVEGPLSFGGTAKSFSLHDPATGACLVAMKEITVHHSNGWKDDYDFFAPQVRLHINELALDRARLEQAVPLPDPTPLLPPRVPRL
jgi:hypothetical protein